MRVTRTLAAVALLFALSAPFPPDPLAAQGTAGGVDTQDTRLLSQPAIGPGHIAFAYAGDLWVANRDGSGVRRITTHAGTEGNPRFSPDGSQIAFNASYDGNLDVYVVAAEGGSPTRLTWHPAPDQVQDFTPDGSAVLFVSGRNSYTSRYGQLYTVPITGGFPEQLPIPNAFKAAFSPDGSKIAYTPLYEAFNQWKNYRGGTVSRIWLYDRSDHSVEEIPQPPERANDTDPMWIGDRVYFRSDRNGEFNLFSFEPGTTSVEQLTSFNEFPILNANADDGTIIFEQAGYLHLFDPGRGQSTRLQVGVAADLIETRPRYAEGNGFIRNAGLSPSGARAAFEFRGEVVTVPAEKGDFRNITRTQGVHERSPSWSPDGRSIAYFSDASGEYELHIAPQDGRGAVRRIRLDGSGFYEDPVWSPDGEWIAFSDNSWSLYLLNLESEEVRRIASEPLYGPAKTLHPTWSPDSRWIAYTLNTPVYFQQVHLYSVEEGADHVITEGLSDVGEPVFDASGKYLFFSASTDAGPLRTWFALSGQDMEISNSLYLAVLTKDTPSPLAKESDEEAVEEESADEEEPGGSESEEEGVRVEIDFDGLHERILSLPVGSGYFYSLEPGAPGELFYLKAEDGADAGVVFGAVSGNLSHFSLDSREEETLLESVQAFSLSADKKKVLVLSRGSWIVADAGRSIEPGSGRLATGDIQVRIDPRTEWEQIFQEAWRINRDYFYDPGMHGADWPAMREKYTQFLPHLSSRQDLNRVIQWMCSELGVGHHRVGGGDFLYDPESVPGGLLGADYEIDSGRYRFAKVYGGLNWNPELRSPLTEPGVGVEEGEYLLAVNGEDLRPPENLYSRFENTTGKIVELTVGPNPDGAGSRTVEVVPVSNESALRNRDWVEGNLKRVEEATDGRVAYVYLPNTSTAGHAYFKRYFFPQAHKEAIIVDERFNGGGMAADYYIDHLRRPYLSSWAMRYGADLKNPLGSIQGPKVMIIDETAGSGGDYLPWMFRQLEMGPLIGKRTWGGLVGTLGFPILMDGGSVTAPNLAIWTEEGGFIVENVGVPPDIEVEQLPAEVIMGRDPQLERAIQEILRMLEADPPHTPQRPPFPIRGKAAMGSGGGR
ncbi:MAG: PDZ domain-containing protein [Gemmatimonadota bacterium]|jgi:tricorn protease